ncbi:hypothetical protein PAMP_024937 [Pampus punctatissimus]
MIPWEITFQTVAVVKANSGYNLVRKKRLWLPPPVLLTENKDYSEKESVAKIHSDLDDGKGNIVYSLEGIGAHLHPFHVFVVNSKTGLIYVTKALDREHIDTYNLRGIAKYKDGRLAEENVQINFKVVDENDNAPVFGDIKPGEVQELSPAGTSVMKVTATDADEPGNDNSKIAYSIIDQNPNDDMFYMDRNGTIYVKKPLLDREKVDQYTVTVKAQDLYGKPGGNSATGTVTINVRDVNDNLPTLEKDEYEGIIEENTEGVEVMRIKALDLDLKYTANWKAVFIIMKGNEAGYFSIRTDPKTNEGILMLVKAVNYEALKNLELGLIVKNVAPSYNIAGAYSRYTVVPYFQLATANICTVCTLAIYDLPAKTATGTIAIQVEDFNDHCPILTNNIQTMCTTNDSIIVTAKDEDAFPNGPPFHFDIVPEGTEGKWQVEHLNDTAAILRSQESIWPGVYEVEFLVKDGQGEACPNPQKVKVHVCTCENGVVCGKLGVNGKPSKGAELGPAGIGLLLLGLLLLLLIPLLLLLCHCGESSGLPEDFLEMPFDTKSYIINYSTEGRGDKTEVPLLNVPTQVGGEIINGGMRVATKTFAMAPMASFDLQKSVSSMGEMNRVIYQYGFASGSCSEFESKEEGGRIYDSMALPDCFIRQYYTQKASSGNENLGVKDALLIYDFEGQGSSAGSMGCCSLLESDNDLQFLDDLGPKFKTLAEVCGGKKISTEVKQELTPLPSASIKTQTSVSSLTTQLLPPAPKLPLTVPRTEQTVVRETSQHSQMVKENMATLRKEMTTEKQEMATQGQMLLLQQQQPVYYTTTPVLQPMQCVVQPQVQNTMLLTEAPATNLQGVVLVNGIQTGPAQGVVVQGQPVMSIGQAQGPGMVLVEKSGVHGSVANLIHAGNLSGTQTMMVVEGKVPSGSMQVPTNCQTCIVQGGTLQSGGLSGSQRVMVVGGPISSRGK